MRRQFQFVWIGVFSFALVLSMSGCASAPTPRFAPPPTATAPAPPPPTVATVPSAVPTQPLAPATTAPSAPAASKPTVAATAAATQAPATKPAAQPTVATTTGTVSKSVCLGCHGPSFDKVIAASTNYVAPSGEKGSPHRYIPHDASGAVNVPECTNCHTAHPLSPLPTAGSIDLSKVGVEWCYTTCHHQNNFTPCAKCHQ